MNYINKHKKGVSFAESNSNFPNHTNQNYVLDMGLFDSIVEIQFDYEMIEYVI